MVNRGIDDAVSALERPPASGIVVSGAIVIEAGFGVRFAPSVLERVHERAGGGSLFAERIERIGLRERTRTIAQ